MTRDDAVRIGSQVVVLTVLLGHVVQEERHTLLITPVGNHAYVPRSVEDDDIPLLPLVMGCRIGGQFLGIPAEKHAKYIGSAEVDIGIRPCYDTGIGRRVRGDIRIDHGLEIVAGMAEVAPDFVGAGSPVVGRVPSLVVAGSYLRCRSAPSWAP